MRGSGRWIACAAASWALVFGAFHVAWAAGWYLGLDDDQARVTFARPWFLAYDLVVGALCLLAAPVALALAMPWGQRLPQRLLTVVVWAGAGILLVRSAASLAQVGYLIASHRFSLRGLGVWEPWFYLGAALFTVSAWQFARSTAATGAA